MRRAYRWVAFALAFILVLVLGVEVVPLADRAIIVGLAIDKNEDSYVVSAQIIMPSEEESKSSGYIISVAEADTVSGALSKISEHNNLIVAMSHCNLVILGKGVIDNDTYASLDYLIRNAYLSENALLLAAEGKASDILSSKTAYSETSAFYIRRALRDFGYYNDRVPRTIKDFLISHNTHNSANWLPVITRTEVQSEQSADQSGGGSEGQSGAEPEYIFDFAKTAIFRDGAYICTVGERETAGIAYVTERLKEGSITVKEGEGGDTFNYYIVSLKGKREYDPDSLVATVKVKAQLILKEEISREEEFMPADIEPSEASRKLVEENIAESIISVFEICREHGVDIFDLYGGFYGKGGAKWRDNNSQNYLGRASVKVETSITYH